MIAKVFHPRIRAQLILHVVLGILLILWAYPVLWTLMSSLKTSGELYALPWAIPNPPHFDNITKAWTLGQLGVAFRNSTLVTSATVLLILLIAAPAAYAFARLELPMRSVVFLAVLIPLMIPAEVTLIPIFVLLRTLGLLNSLQGLVIATTSGGVAFATVILTSFFQAVPRELEDACKLDGGGRFQVLRFVVLPLSVPGIMAVTVFEAVFVWNDYFLPLIVIQKPALFTVQLALGNFRTFYYSDQIMLFAGLAIIMTVPLVVFVLLQRTFIQGMTLGAMRE